jgi:RNA-dependent RNA polymerase
LIQQFQIRYLGYKGVIVVDEQLVGIKMRLRGSMKKFEGHQSGDYADIEIADSFEIPRISHLNR